VRLCFDVVSGADRVVSFGIRAGLDRLHVALRDAVVFQGRARIFVVDGRNPVHRALRRHVVEHHGQRRGFQTLHPEERYVAFVAMI
jgi:hypothetical protein